MEGWIKIHRKLKDHWIWKSENRLKWWIDILITVNHADTKVLIKGSLIEVKRGQSIRSLDSWAKDWNVSKGSVRDFFNLLKSDHMIQSESLRFTTRITVCKYEDYQGSLNAEETLRKRRGNAEETLRVHKQERKELNNENNENNILSIFEKFRIKYPGTKRGLDIEFSNFSKKYNPEIIGELVSGLEKEIDHRKRAVVIGAFIPEWKNLQTWINQKCWEQEFQELAPKINIPQNNFRVPKFENYVSGQHLLQD